MYSLQPVRDSVINNPEQPTTTNVEQPTTTSPELFTTRKSEQSTTKKPEQPTTINPEQPTTKNSELVTTDDTSPSCGTSVDVINLMSTIANEDHILWPNEEVIFTCETRGSILVNKWTSNDYIGDGISILFNNLELGNDTQSGSRSIAKLIKVSYNYVMVSQLHIMTSSEFQTSSVACTNFNGTSKNITFSVLGN